MLCKYGSFYYLGISSRIVAEKKKIVCPLFKKARVQPGLHGIKIPDIPPGEQNLFN